MSVLSTYIILFVNCEKVLADESIGGPKVPQTVPQNAQISKFLIFFEVCSKFS